jgi:LmbE family N-acetylglucosaminyl deacetylase
VDFSNKKILVILAHQDDETIGCGGSLKKWSRQGADIEVCFMTNGSTGVQQGKDGTNIVEDRMEEARQAATILGIRKVSCFSLPCQQVVNKKDNFHKVIKKIREVKPDLLITHNDLCKHRDHKRTYEIVKEAAWKASENILEQLGPTHVTNCVWSCEILDPLDRVDFCVDISETWIYKMRAMDRYGTQTGILGSIEDYLDGITKVRGYAVGCSRAESYKAIGNKPIKI